ncbi:MAG: AMP nucleosidase, partial [Alphaproteobacteria bacterium]
MAQARTTKCLTPEDAVNQLEDLYTGATRALAEAMDTFITTGEPPARKTRALFRYPLLRITHRDMTNPRLTHNRAFGKLEHPGVYETTITNPEAFRSYLLEQLELLMREYDIEIEVEISDQEIPFPYVIER